jgi:hypothetical protein
MTALSALAAQIKGPPMTHPTQVLSDEQIEDWIETLAVHHVWGKVLSHAKSREFARAIESATLEALAKQEPFGYFKAEPFGWTDCAETDEGAVALYERPQKSA